MKIVVNSGFGIETATKLELKRMGIEAPCENGKFIFDGHTEDLVNCNLNLRTADRVFLLLNSFKAVTFDELFDGVKETSWIDIIPENARIIVNAKSVGSTLFSLSAIQSISKKAIVDKLKTKYVSLPEDGDEHLIQINLFNDEVSVLLDTSGDGLHKRGYRNLVWEAPIKETIAAAMIILSVWNKDKPLIDAFTGSGTIPIEAAMQAFNIPSGLYRNFAFEKYFFIDKTVLDNARTLGKEGINFDGKIKISGYDINKKAIHLAFTHAKNFNLEKYIHFETNDMRNISSSLKYGVIISNPPYGERLLQGEELKTLYRDFGKMYRSLSDWSLYAITSYSDFERYFGGRATKTRKIYNAKLECKLYQYLGAKPPKKTK